MDIANTPTVLGVVAVVAVVAMNYTKNAARRRLLHKERMAALDKGVPLPEDLLADAEATPDAKSPARNAAMQGTVWAALGLGMLAASRLTSRADFGSEMRQLLDLLEVWAYPATFVGLGLLVFAFFARDKK